MHALDPRLFPPSFRAESGWRAESDTGRSVNSPVNPGYPPERALELLAQTLD
jgi:hypothetical protein